MTASLEIWRASGQEVRQLDGGAVSIGRTATTVVLDDATVSRLHAAVVPMPGGWVVRDLGSRNGTFVNGVRLAGDRALIPGDEVRVGPFRMVFRGARDATAPSTRGVVQEDPPDLTRREHEVLLVLCRPLVDSPTAFLQAAPVAQIADTLCVTESAVKQHLAHLYDKFGLYSSEDRRRNRLAAEAIHRGAVTLGALRSAR